MLLLLACDLSPCTFGPDLPTCAEAEACRRDSEVAHAECVEAVAWGATCSADWHGGATSRTALLTEGHVCCPSASIPDFQLIEDAAAWSALLAAVKDLAPGRSVDFTREAVAVAHHGVSSSCGMEATRHGLWAPSGGPAQLYVSWEDTTGACGGACDQPQHFLVAYVVARGTAVELCGEVVQRCR